MNQDQLLQKKARILSLAGDSTRIRMLCVLFEEDEACVSEIAKRLDMSVASISHHLQLLRDNNMVASRRDGHKICYRILDSNIMSELQKLICETDM